MGQKEGGFQDEGFGYEDWMTEEGTECAFPYEASIHLSSAAVYPILVETTDLPILISSISAASSTDTVL